MRIVSVVALFATLVSAIATWVAFLHIQDPPITRIAMTQPAPVPVTGGPAFTPLPVPTMEGMFQAMFLQPFIKPYWLLLLTFLLIGITFEIRGRRHRYA
jgi:hypothetical protein